MSTKQQIRCAIYTRKSTEEGLEQDFNSLHAQRDACEAYITSQRSEGWIALKALYDDGGFSGGTLERPALQKLLHDIEAGLVDVVVVYKIDRLSRSLMDFAKLVEVFDRKSVTFVSVTQSFNTTSSMGRLTLNVLLSFAQFEREVTGERIRDKFAASKRKGIWMGGTPPLGYDVLERKLVVNQAEADIVRMIFGRYLELGSVRLLRDALAAKQIRSKSWTSRTGKVHPGYPLSRGALYHLLKNRIYVGEIAHKGKSYPGEHAGIVAVDLFEAVQAKIAEARQTELGKVRARRTSLLAGLLFGEAGTAMTPTHGSNRLGRRYRYYIDRTDRADADGGRISRVSATALEAVILDAMRRLKLIGDCGDGAAEVAARALLCRVDLGGQLIALHLNRDAALQTWCANSGQQIRIDDSHIVAHARQHLSAGETLIEEPNGIRLTLPVRACFRGGRKSILYSDKAPATTRRPNATLIKALARAHRWKEMLLNGDAESIDALAKRHGMDRAEAGRMLNLAFLSPTITRAIIDGRQHPDLRLKHLLDMRMPLSWHEQQSAIER